MSDQGGNVELQIKATNLTQQAFDAVSNALKALEAAQKPVNDEGSKLTKWLDDLTPKTNTAHNAFNDLKGTLESMWENPIEGVKGLATALFQDLTGGLGAAGAAIGIVIAVGAVLGGVLIDLGSKAEEVGASIGRMSTQFNVGVPELSRLRFAVVAAGGDFDAFGNSMFMFQQRIENSSDKVSKGLQLIGLSLGDIKSLNPDEQFLKISDALREADGSVNKAAAAFDIFGKQGRDMLPLLLKPLSDLADKSDELGDTWNEKDVAAARAFRGEMTLMGAEIEGTWTSIGRDVAPVTDVLVLAWERTKLAFANVLRTVVEAPELFQKAADGIRYMLGSTGDLELKQQSAAAQQDTINRAIEMGASGNIKYADAIKYINLAFNGFVQPATDAKALLDDWNKQLDANTKKLSDQQALRDALENSTGFVAGGTFDFAGEEEATKKAAEALKKYEDAWGEIASRGGDWRDLTSDLDKNVLGLAVDLLSAGNSVDTVAAAIPDLTKSQVDAISKGLLPYIDAWSQLNSLGTTVQDTVDGLDQQIVAEVESYLAAGASIKTVGAAYPELTAAQLQAIDQLMKGNDKYEKSWETTQAEITKVWDEALFAEKMNGLKGLDLEIAKLNAQAQKEKDAAAAKIKDEDQLGQTLDAIDAKYDALRGQAKTKNDQEVAAKTNELWTQYYDTVGKHSATATDFEIAQVQRWYDDQVDKAIKAGIVDQKYYDALDALAQAKIQDVRNQHDLLYQDIIKIQNDLQGGWEKSFGDTLVKTGSFKDAFKSVFDLLKQDVEKIFADMLANIIEGFLAPLEAKLGGFLADLAGLSSSGGGDGGGGGLLGWLKGLIPGGGQSGGTGDDGNPNTTDPPGIVFGPPNPNHDSTGGIILPFSKGGIVPMYASVGYSPVGTDTVPAMLSEHEGVLTSEAVNALGALNSGHSLSFDVSGVERHLGDLNRLTKATHRLLQQLLTAQPNAFRDALLLAGVLR